MNTIELKKHKQKITGEGNPSAKLTEKQVLEIIELRKQKILFKSIAKKFNTTVGNIENIIYGRSWKHLNKKHNNYRSL